MSWILSAFADEAGGTTDEQIAALKRAGYKHIDLRSVDGHNISALPVEVAQASAKKLSAAGIKVNMFGSPIGKIDIADDFKIDLDKLTHLGKLSKIFGCNQVRIFSYYNKKQLDAARWHEEALNRLTRLRDLAGQLGLVLYHENESHIFGDRIGNILKIKEKVRDGKTFKLIFDFDNYNRDGDDVWDNWTKLTDATDAFHLKDSDKQSQHVPIGQGNGRAHEILTDAVKRGWHGPLILEPHLRHSKAVQATIVSGVENKAFADMAQADVFHVAATTATKLLQDIKAPMA